jgi:glutathione S-transferase
MADEPLIFYTNPKSRGSIARWMLEEVGAPYRTVSIDYGPAMQDPAYLAINPMAKVPALTHGDRVITETAAICLYLADAFPEAGMAPPPADRAAYYRWMAFGAGPLDAALTNRGLGVVVPPDKQGFVGYGDFDRVVRTLETALSASPYMAGEAFTTADVYTGSQIGFALRFGAIEPRPVFADYWARITARPAYARASA